MRYQDWTFRQAESRLAEPRDWREALHLRCGPDDTTLYRFLQRLDEDPVARGLGETVRHTRSARTFAVASNKMAEKSAFGTICNG